MKTLTKVFKLINYIILPLASSFSLCTDSWSVSFSSSSFSRIAFLSIAYKKNTEHWALSLKFNYSNSSQGFEGNIRQGNISEMYLVVMQS